MATDRAQARAEVLLARIAGQIPLTAAMQLQLRAFDGERLRLGVPLAPNINDKGTGFAGSISALANIAGWCLLTLWGEAELGHCQVAIAEASLRYRKPVVSDFEAEVGLPAAPDMTTFRQRLAEKGRARLTLVVDIRDRDGVAASMTADYVLWKI
ncbi:MAG: YiiD C-terminal domain-containing protein [Moraxellaceae bacterium]